MITMLHTRALARPALVAHINRPLARTIIRARSSQQDGSNSPNGDKRHNKDPLHRLMCWLKLRKQPAAPITTRKQAPVVKHPVPARKQRQWRKNSRKASSTQTQKYNTGNTYNVWETDDDPLVVVDLNKPRWAVWRKAPGSGADYPAGGSFSSWYDNNSIATDSTTTDNGSWWSWGKSTSATTSDDDKSAHRWSLPWDKTPNDDDKSGHRWLLPWDNTINDDDDKSAEGWSPPWDNNKSSVHSLNTSSSHDTSSWSWFGNSSNTTDVPQDTSNNHGTGGWSLPSWSTSDWTSSSAHSYSSNSHSHSFSWPDVGSSSSHGSHSGDWGGSGDASGGGTDV